MLEDDLTPSQRERHRHVYATEGLPGFAVFVVDDRLLAGRNPLTAVDVSELRRQGVTHVLDLREEGEWLGPGRFGAEAVEALGARGVERLNVPVPDTEPPTPEVLDACVAWIEDVLAQRGTKVFVHCRGGRERTGCVLAALFAGRGADLESALLHLRRKCGAAPLPAQLAAVQEWAATRRERVAADRRERILGCFLGGAIGDALGAPVEFDSLAKIRKRFGPAGVAGFAGAKGREGAFTDDTQMTLFTAEGLIRAQQLWAAQGSCHAPSVVRHAYLRWLDTQGEAEGVEGAEDALRPGARGWLVDEPLLRRRVAPGSTCIAGLRSGRLGSREERLNDSKGCGGVMRVAPVGLIASAPFELGCDLAALTHGHPSGFLAAGSFAVAIEAVARGAPLSDAVSAARQAAAGDPEGGEVVLAIDRAVHAASAGRAAPEVLESLGQGWVAEEALGIAVYCALVEPDPRRALLLAVNHSGDSDSTGSMVGQLLGAAHGVRGLPDDWIAALEGREVVAQVAGDFAARFVDGLDLDAARYPAG